MNLEAQNDMIWPSQELVPHRVIPQPSLTLFDFLANSLAFLSVQDLASPTLGLQSGSCLGSSACPVDSLKTAKLAKDRLSAAVRPMQGASIKEKCE